LRDKIGRDKKEEHLSFPSAFHFPILLLHNETLPHPSFLLLQAFRCLSLVLLLSERAALCESGSTTGRLAKHSGASSADDDRLRVGEDRGDVEATLALDVHEERVWRLHQTLKLVRLLSHGGRWVQEVNIAMQNHVCSLKVSVVCLLLHFP